MNKLKEFRLSKKLPLYEFARLTHVSAGTISKLERTGNAPTYLIAKRIAETFNVDVNEIFPEINLHVGRSRKYPTAFNPLRELRFKKQISLRELAENVGVSESLIFRYETGSRKPTYKIAKKISDFFGVSVEELFPQFKDSTKKETPTGV